MNDALDTFNAQVKKHKQQLATALRNVMEVADDHQELYAETGTPGIIAQSKSIAQQLADQLDPPNLEPKKEV